jgi:hypothetical protein
VDDQPVFVATQIKDHPIIADEIDSATELPLYFGRISPMCLGRNRDPGQRPRLPALLQHRRTTGSTLVLPVEKANRSASHHSATAKQ